MPVGVTIRQTELAALANVRTMLELCASGALRCSVKTQRPTSAAMSLVTAHLVDGDWYDDEPIAAFAWPLLVQAGGLAKRNGTCLELTAKGRAALKAPAHDTIRALWQRWITHGLIDELSRVENIKGQRTARTLTAAGPRRLAAAGALTLLHRDAWTPVDDVFAALRNRFFAAQSERALWRLYLGEDAEDGAFGYAGFYEWDFIEGRYLLAVLLEYAATLGLVDVELAPPQGARDDFRVNAGGEELPYLSRYDGLRALRLTALGAFAAGLAPAYEPASTDSAHFTVDDNLMVVAAAGVPSPSDKLLLAAFAEETGPGRWQVSRISLLDAVDAGRSPDELIGFLAVHADGIPQALTDVVDGVRRAVQQLTDLGPVRLIECRDQTIAAQLARHPGLRRLCRRVGTTHLAVDLDKVPAFRKALREAGFVLGEPPQGR